MRMGGIEARSARGQATELRVLRQSHRRIVRATTGLAALAMAWAMPAEAGRGGIEDPTGRAVLQVAFRGQPTYQDVAEAQAALTRAAEILCDATEGQVRVGQIRLTSSPGEEDLASLWLHDGDAASGGPYDGDGRDLGRLGAHMDAFSSVRLRPDHLAHLFGHHAFGLGDQYDEQRRRGGACGIGPGFELSRLDERNHSIMQGAGGMRCLEGPLVGQDCVRDDECGASACVPVLASEWSVASNHDPLRGDGGVCPPPSSVSRVRLGGLLPKAAQPVGRLNSSDFLSARATSSWHDVFEVVDPRGSLPGIRLQFYLAHVAPLAWQLAVGVDSGELGGKRGQLRILRDWKLTFNEDFSLARVEPEVLRFELPGVGGRAPIEVAIDLGSRNPDAQADPGHGYDGFQMVAAGSPVVEVVVDGVVGCDAPWCASSWNSSTGRWELSEQSILHGGASDWQTITANLPFLVSPTSLPTSETLPVCRTPPEFITDVMGADQVVLVMDTSRSTGMRVDGKAGEVCANGLDDDDDGSADEADCADSVLEYERTALRAFLALAAGRKLQIGLVTIHTDAEVLSDIEEVGGARRSALGALLASVKPEGGTAMGTALERAQEALKKVERVGRSRTVFLVTDGARNVGVDPGQEARVLDPAGYRVFTVGIGNAADRMRLAAIAARGGGVAMSASRANATPAILAELAVRHGGDTLLLERTPFDLSRDGGGKAPSSREFALQVEEQASELVVFLSTRADRIDDWRLLFELEGPDGRRFDDTGPQSRIEHGFAVLRIADPRPGAWRLRVLPDAGGIQRSEVLAYTVHDHADFFIDADPRLASQSRPVRLGARLAYVTDIDGDISIDGMVRRPDGSEVEVTLARDPVTRAWSTDFSGFAGRGHYEVRLRAKVGEGAAAALGERVFPGPERAPVRVVPFERSATASFYVADGPPPPCSSNDCDDDGIANRVEAGCGDDSDGDGMPNRLDADADNDEIFDGLEGTRDFDKDGVPDFCDPESAPTSLAQAIEAEELAVASACGEDAASSVAGLRSSLSSVRRILQEVRTRGSLPVEMRRDLVDRLERVIELKKQALVIGDVLPEFCGKYKSRLEEALAVERDVRADVDALLGP